MTDFQRFLYRLFLHKLSQTSAMSGRKNLLFQAYQSLLRVWNHPCVTVMSYYDDQAVVLKKKNADSKIKTAASAQSTKTGKLTAIAKDLAPVVRYFEENSLQINAELDASAQVEDKLLGTRERLSSSPIANKNSDSESESDGDAFFDDDREWDMREGGPLQSIACVVDEERFVKLSKLLEDLDVTALKRENISDVYIHGRVTIVEQKIVEISVSPFEVRCCFPVDYYKANFVSVVPDTCRVLQDGTLGNDTMTWLLDFLEQSIFRVVDSEAMKASTARPSILQPNINGGHLVPNDWWIIRSPNGTSAASKEPDTSNPIKAPFFGTAPSTDEVLDLSESSEPALDTISPSDMLKLGNKVVVFLSLLALSVTNGEKMIMFSQSINTLNLIELVLGMSSWGEFLLAEQPMEDIRAATYESLKSRKFSNWTSGREFLRIDGSTNGRQSIIDEFNKQPHIKLLIISTKAGNMGINLQGASRVVLFDCSWNPAHDLQAIFRAYRYGQRRSVFVYRLVASGTMEEKIHMRQVDKQTLSARVVDAQMVLSH